MAAMKKRRFLTGHAASASSNLALIVCCLFVLKGYIPVNEESSPWLRPLAAPEKQRPVDDPRTPWDESKGECERGLSKDRSGETTEPKNKSFELRKDELKRTLIDPSSTTRILQRGGIGHRFFIHSQGQSST